MGVLFVANWNMLKLRTIDMRIRSPPKDEIIYRGISALYASGLRTV